MNGQNASKRPWQPTYVVTPVIFTLPLLGLAGVTLDKQAPLDGIDLTPYIASGVTDRPQPMGFWDHVVNGVLTPSKEWMGQLLSAQQQGQDLPPHETSIRAAELPNPPHAEDQFPGHAALAGWQLEAAPHCR